MRRFAAAAVLLVASNAHAGGLDVPTVYTARHAAAGGTAVGYVDDASATFHNPAGLAGVDGLELLGNVSLFATSSQTSPHYPDQHLHSGVQLAPAPFLAAAYDLHDWISVGVASYPIGAVGGTFEYEDRNGVPQLNEQFALAVEISPAMAVRLPAAFSLGIGYRITVLEFDRHLGPAEDPSTVDLESRGVDFRGLRFGAQWSGSEHLQLGVAYRHRTSISPSADGGRLLGQPLTDIVGDLVIPAKFSAGARLTWAAWSLALDYELAFNSQFKNIEVAGRLPSGDPLDVDFAFNWHDSSTAKAGLMFAPNENVTLRVGYAFDENYVNQAFPSTFSGPPTDSHYVTWVAGYARSSWQVNFAFTHRLARSARIEEEQIAALDECAFCGYSGRYQTGLSGALIDFSTHFDL